MSYVEDRKRHAVAGLLFDAETLLHWAETIRSCRREATGFHGRFEQGLNEDGQMTGYLILKAGPMPQLGEAVTEDKILSVLNVSHPSPPFPC